MSVRRPLEAAAAIIAIAFPLAIGFALVRTAVDLPLWDEWEWADLVMKLHAGTLTLGDLWLQHNDSRLFFPQLMLVLLDRFGGWSPVRETFVSLFFIVCTQVVLFVLIRRTIHGAAALVAALLATIVLYGLWQDDNLTWGYRMSWFMCNAGCVASIACLTRAQRGSAYVVGAVAAAVFASFSASQGLVVWIAGAVAIIAAQRRTGTTLFGWIVAAAVTGLVFRHALVPVATAGHIALLHHPLLALRYACTDLGSPVAGWAGAAPSFVAGLIGCVIVAWSVARDLRGTSMTRHFLRRGPWYALATYGIAASVLAAAGRAGFGVDDARASELTTISGVFWIAVIAGAATIASERRRSSAAARRLMLASALVAAVGAVSVVQSEAYGWHAWRQSAAAHDADRLGLERDDPAVLPHLYPDRDRLLRLIDGLRAIHDGPFL
jgi:hypothetical protein